MPLWGLGKGTGSQIDKLPTWLKNRNTSNGASVTAAPWNPGDVDTTNRGRPFTNDVGATYITANSISNKGTGFVHEQRYTDNLGNSRVRREVLVATSSGTTNSSLDIVGRTNPINTANIVSVAFDKQTYNENDVIQVKVSFDREVIVAGATFYTGPNIKMANSSGVSPGSVGSAGIAYAVYGGHAGHYGGLNSPGTQTIGEAYGNNTNTLVFEVTANATHGIGTGNITTAFATAGDGGIGGADPSVATKFWPSFLAIRLKDNPTDITCNVNTHFATTSAGGPASAFITTANVYVIPA